MNTLFLQKKLSRALVVSVAFITLSMSAIGASSTHFISGFLAAKQSIPIPVNNVVTTITGKMNGDWIAGPVAFTAIRVNSNLFIAQLPIGSMKKAVFLQIDYYNKTIKPLSARYCRNCQNRNVNLNDTGAPIANSSTARGYGIIDITLSIKPIPTVTTTFPTYVSTFPNFVRTHDTAIPNFTNGSVITNITGKMGGGSIGIPVDFTAIKLSNHSFLAQIQTSAHKKGVFFEISNEGKIKTTYVRYCPISSCKNRNLKPSDIAGFKATSQTTTGYGIFDLKITNSPYGLTAYTGFVSNHATTLPDFINGSAVTSVTGKMGGGSIGIPVDFTAIRLGTNSFLAQTRTSAHKKGVFFEISNDGKIKTTAIRYCYIHSCKNRNLTLSDIPGIRATNQTRMGYGIFDLKIASLSNLSYGLTATQSSSYEGTDSYVARRAVDGDTNGGASTGSVSITNSEQSAWWQVDLGSEKLIQKIHIFNRTDCCKNRLSHYRVSILDNFDTLYQQDFHTYPNPSQVIDFDIEPLKGRYVKIQLLDKNFLSLAEVEVWGHDLKANPFLQVHYFKNKK